MALSCLEPSFLRIRELAILRIKDQVDGMRTMRFICAKGLKCKTLFKVRRVYCPRRILVRILVFSEDSFFIFGSKLLLLTYSVKLAAIINSQK